MGRRCALASAQERPVIRKTRDSVLILGLGKIVQSILVLH
jgi:hypothetical protein